MNGHGNMTPSNTQYPNSYTNDGGKRTGASSSSRRSLLPPISPHSRIPLTRLPAGSPYFTAGPRPMTQRPVFSSLPTSSTAWTSFRDSVPPVNPPPSFLRDTLPSANPSPSSFRYDSLPSANPSFHRRESLPPTNPASSSSFPSMSPAPSTCNDSLQPLFHGSPSAPPDSTYPSLADLLLDDSSCDNEDVDESKSDAEAREKLYNEFFNLDNNNASNNEKKDDVMKNTSDGKGDQINENENSYKTGATTVGVKRRAGKEIEPLRKHSRSVSMDSCFTESPNQAPPSMNPPGKVSSTNSVDGNKDGVYTAYELKMIANSSKLREVASDPKHVRRILANRESAQRSKQRKAQYIFDLENRVNKLENNAIISLSTKVALLENDKMLRMNENRELRIRVESLEQHAKLRDALIEHMRREFQSLKGIYEASQNRSQFDSTNMQSLDPNMFQQQLNTNQFNQPPTNPDFYGQGYGN